MSPKPKGTCKTHCRNSHFGRPSFLYNFFNNKKNRLFQQSGRGHYRSHQFLHGLVLYGLTWLLYLSFLQMDVEARFCTVSALSRRHIMILKITFPSYPEKAPPKVIFLPATTLDSTLKHKLHKILEDTCLRQVENNRLCLEACLQQLSASLDGMKVPVYCSMNATNAPGVIFLHSRWRFFAQNKPVCCFHPVNVLINHNHNHS